MASKAQETIYYADGTFDQSGGVDSSKVTTLASTLNPNGLARNQLAWLNNATVRDGGITQRTGWQPLAKVLASGYWQGGYIYEPDAGNPYLVCQISGILYKVLLDPPYTVTALNALLPALQNPASKAIAEMAWFCQAENYLIIQAGDYYTQPNLMPVGALNAYGQPLAIGGATLPLIWDGTVLRRSRGITTTVPPAIANGYNEIPAATCMDYYGGHLWYAQARQLAAGDMVGGPSGTPANHKRDSLLNVTENPICFGGDGFSTPTYSGNIRSLAHSANINAALGQGQFFVMTRKTVYSMTVPTTRTDWINSDSNNTPYLAVVQLNNGTVGDRCIVKVNGDIFYQSFEPGIRSLIIAQRYFAQWANTTISQNERRALETNDRSLMRFSSGINFDNRMLQLVLPQLAADGQNIVHQAMLPLDFDVVSNLSGESNPVWEGVYGGLPFIQLFTSDFGGLPRAFSSVISEVDGSINIWELTTSSRTENGDNRVVWSAEFPAFTWETSKLEYHLKQLRGGEAWVDSISGTVDFDAYYRVDGDPCWRFWFHDQFCTARNCQEQEPVGVCYPPQDFREGYKFSLVFPQPPVPGCDSMNVRPSTLGYQFQVKFIIKGWCRIRGLLLYAEAKQKPQYAGVSCQAPAPLGKIVSPSNIPATPPAPACPLPLKATNPGLADGATGVDPRNVVLSWQGNGNTASYRVIVIGLPANPSQVATSFSLGNLLIGTQYSWRVDSVNSCGVTTGDTWTFTTANCPPLWVNPDNTFTNLSAVTLTLQLLNPNIWPNTWDIPAGTTFDFSQAYLQFNGSLPHFSATFDLGAGVTKTILF